MSSLTNQQSNTKSLTGLSDTYSTNIVCDTFEVSDEFTIDNGCIVNIPANSIPDSALSTNVALKNGANIFTNTNTFNDTVTISRTANQLFILDPVNTAPSTISQSGTILNISSITGIAGTTITLSARTSTNANAQVFTGSSGRVSIGLASAIIDLRPLICNIFGTTMTYPTAGTAISGGVLTYANNLVNNGTITNNGNVLFTVNDIHTANSRYKNNTTTNETAIFQNSTGLSILNVNNLENISLSTRDTLGTPLANITCSNGNRIQLQGTTAGEIDITGTSVTLSGVCSFTNVTTPVITKTIPTIDNTTKIATTAWVNLQNYITSASLTPYALLAPVSQIFSGNNNFPTQTTSDNSTLVATTAFVKNQGYAQLAGTQTFTGTNTFALSGSEVEFNGGCLFNDISLGPSSTLINQTGIECHIENTHDMGSVRLRSRNGIGIPLDNVYAVNGNTGGLQGNSGNIINITGTQATIGGTSVPVITTQPNSTVSNNNEIASTKFVRDQLYATTASLSAYALLTANQTFTGTQTLVAADSVTPIRIKTSLAGYTAYSGGSLITNSGSYNSINTTGDYSVIGFGTGINTGGALTLTTHSSTNCGIRITNTEVTQTVPFTCGYLQLGTPVTTKTNYQMGFINTILFAGFTGNAWATSSGAYNIMTIAWNGTGDYTLGVWQVEIVIISQCTSAPTISFTWNTLTATSMSLNLHSGSVSDMGAYAGVGASIFRMSFVLNVTDLLKNYFLNCSRVGGTTLSSDSNSYIKFTRLA